MHPFDFIWKNRKILAVVGLILVCGGIALLMWTVRKDTDGQSYESHGEILENETTKTYAEPQIGQGTETEETFVTESLVETEEEVVVTEEATVTEESEPVLTDEYELIYEGINIFHSGTTGTYFKDKDICADLYVRRLQDDIEEYVELSLWSDQKEIWHTINSDYVEECSLFWQDDSSHLTLNQGMCYYVVELDETVYLMRYCVETASNVVTMCYKVFGISTIGLSGFNGNEVPYDAGSISIFLATDSFTDTAVSFPVEQMVAFAETVKGYMENGHMVASTLHGVFELETSADRDNPISAYLYDIFPWIPELVTQHDVNTEGIYSSKDLLIELQKVLPNAASITMPDVAAEGDYFITGDYYSENDESYLLVRMKEKGYYEGTLLIANALNVYFTGCYNNKMLTATERMDSLESFPYEMEISFENGKATVTITATSEWSIVDVGNTFVLDRNEKPEDFECLRNVEDYSMRE